MEKIKEVINGILDSIQQVFITLYNIPGKIKISIGNLLLKFVMWFVGAKNYRISYKKK